MVIARNVLATLLAVFALYYAVTALWLGVSLTRAMPYYDQWEFIHTDYASLLKGWAEYPIRLLFRQNNEHRIATTRLILLVDAFWFQMRGWLPLFISYATMGGIAWVLATLAEPADRLTRLVGFLLLLAIVWSIAQWEVFGWAYEVFFPLQHLLALAALIALAKAVNDRSYLWLGVALACDLFAIWSSASGLLLTASFVALCIWLRAANRVVAIFFSIHALMLASYFIGYYVPPSPGLPGWDVFFRVLIDYLGWPFKAWLPQSVPVIGWFYLAAFVTLAVVATFKRADRNLVILLAFGSFVFIEGMALAYARPWNGTMYRHAAMPILFTAAMVAILWHALSPRLRLIAPALAVLAIIASNHESFATAWRDRTAFLDRVATDVHAGEYSDDWAKVLTPDYTKWLKGDLDLLRQQRVGPFAN
jgi:hypothetical protein